MSLRKPPLYKIHSDADPEFTDFGGWIMPIEFDGIRNEHSAVRNSVGIFDVSHMGEIKVSGMDATELMNRLTTNDVRELGPGGAQYSCILDDEGIIIDDTVVYRYPESDGYLFVPNAGHDEEMANHWSECAHNMGLSVSIENVTQDTGLFAVQGPEAMDTVEDAAANKLSDLSRFEAKQSEIAGINCLIARTGYTGEDGVEIFCPASGSESVWSEFQSVQPCGLGARDILRMEAGLLLSSQDFDPETEARTPIEAKLQFFVDLSKPDFVGQESLKTQQADGTEQKLIGLVLNERGIPRNGYEIHSEGGKIGHVTSGTLSPTLSEPIGIGYVDTKFSETGTEVEVLIRDRPVDATVVGHRFLDSLSKE